MPRPVSVLRRLSSGVRPSVRRPARSSLSPSRTLLPCPARRPHCRRLSVRRRRRRHRQADSRDGQPPPVSDQWETRLTLADQPERSPAGLLVTVHWSAGRLTDPGRRQVTTDPLGLQGLISGSGRWWWGMSRGGCRLSPVIFRRWSPHGRRDYIMTVNVGPRH